MTVYFMVAGSSHSYPPVFRTTPCRLPLTAYSPSKSSVRPFHSQPEDTPRRGDKGPA